MSISLDKFSLLLLLYHQLLIHLGDDAGGNPVAALNDVCYSVLLDQLFIYTAASTYDY